MKFAYEMNNSQIIINHGKTMLEKYSKIIGEYASIFEQYNCSLKVGLYWNNLMKNCHSNSQLPFKNGYSCYVYCEVQKDGKEVRIISTDGEVDYYSLSATWIISSIERGFFRTNVLLYSDTDNAETDIKEFILLLSKHTGDS